MTAAATCPRCQETLDAPTLMHSDWRCRTHGSVAPYQVRTPASAAMAAQIAARSRVPVWTPSPLPPGWTVTGFGHAGDDRSGHQATVVACTGPSPVGGPVDLHVIAEELGTGLGARYAGTTDDAVGPALATASSRRLRADGHSCALWRVPTPDDRVGYVGEAAGVWLWLVLWPSDGDLVLVDGVEMADLRQASCEHLEFGAPGPYLTAG